MKNHDKDFVAVSKYELALYDMAFNRWDLSISTRDEENVHHYIKFSRLRISGLMVDICKKWGNVTVYELCDIEGDPEKVRLLPPYLRQAVYEGQCKRKTL